MRGEKLGANLPLFWNNDGKDRPKGQICLLAKKEVFIIVQVVNWKVELKDKVKIFFNIRFGLAVASWSKDGKSCNHRLLSSSIAAVIIGSGTFLSCLLLLFGCSSWFAKNLFKFWLWFIQKAESESNSKLCMFKHVYFVCFQPFQPWFATAHAFPLTPGS